ncbi:bifunctional acetate--CoA ligase family protein/GNAT family N-acetyltransferase [Actinokineospora bangkokensis]|uniref:N-acetyltransferase domain-containing protein n=1 Tax=Actinokineospora bangkokensis TaxID=1193682 RepID=A0A1Q9LR34_9PSEU|nr:GNAT family N-acetyltransferase [Actinokineospora bangkokensis]OLR94451.1 hypothetical protein BJP25_11910 [Actinokineospora bangkokensis]
MTDVDTAQPEPPTAVWALAADGTTVEVRELGAGDAPAVRGLYADLRPEDRYLRFFTLCRAGAGKYVDSITTNGGEDRPAFGAFHGGRLLGVASLATAAEGTSAELAVVVARDEQAHGIGTLLLEWLVAKARERGIGALTADVLAANPRMLRALGDLGLPLRCERDEEVLHVTIPLAPATRYPAAVDTRDRIADLLSLRPLLHPRSVVVVGAGRHPRSVGHAVLRNLLHGGFTGALAVVNPHARQVLGVPSHPSVTTLPFTPDLAVVCVPAADVVRVVRDCAERGVRAVVVISSGVSALPGAVSSLRRAAREHDVRVVGPNCVGVVNNARSAALDATFLDRVPGAGSVGVLAQSGGVAIALAHDLDRIGLGVSTLVSLGDEVDVSANDLLQWCIGDAGTGAVVAYLESHGNPRRFARLGAALSRRKPLVVVRAGSSEVGQRAATSHTAGLTSPPVALAALHRRVGATTVDGIAEAVEVLVLFGTQPLPAGPRVAVVTNAGGIGVLAADACTRAGLGCAALTADTRARLAELLTTGAVVSGPVDTTAVVDGDVFAAAVGLVAADPVVDAVITATVPTALGDPADGTGQAARQAHRLGVPILVVRPGSRTAVTAEAHGELRVPVYADVDPAARALAHAVARCAWLARPVVPARVTGLDDAAVLAAYDRTTTGDDGWVDPQQSLELLASLGVPTAAGRTVAPADAVAEIARAVAEHGPVAVKAVTGGLLHKSAAGGVHLGVTDGIGPVASLVGTFGDRLTGVFVQPMVAEGGEWLVGVRGDPRFGPLVVCGPGGNSAGSAPGHRVRLCPLTEADVADLVAGSDDPIALAEVVRRIAYLAELVPAVRELDINPVIVRPGSTVAVDARVRLVPLAVQDPLLRALPG